MCACCEFCVLSGRGLCEELITRPGESYRLWCIVACDLETWRMRSTWSALDRSATKTNVVLSDLRDGRGVECHFTSYSRLHKNWFSPFYRVRPHCSYCLILAWMHSVTCGQLAACGGSTRIHGCVVEKCEPNKVGFSGLINRCYLAMCSEILRRQQSVTWTDSLESCVLLGR